MNDYDVNIPPLTPQELTALCGSIRDTLVRAISTGVEVGLRLFVRFERFSIDRPSTWSQFEGPFDANKCISTAGKDAVLAQCGPDWHLHPHPSAEAGASEVEYCLAPDEAANSSWKENH